MAKPRISPEDQRFLDELGARIVELRSERGLTQAQLAEMLGYTQQVSAR
jgi:DNA-binding XRE family transcriptional regulator